MKNAILLFISMLTSLCILAQDSEKSNYLLPKGSFLISPTFNLSQDNGTNNTILGVKIEEQYKLTYSIRSNAAYFIADDFSIGLQVGYTNDQSDITYFPNGIETTVKKYSNLVSLYPNIRNYFGKGIFKGFAQTNLGVAFGKGLERSYSTDDDAKTESNQYIFTLAVQPGVAVFVANFVSVELSINLIGLTSKFESSTYNDGTESIYNSNNVDFDINIFSLNIGIGFYIGTGNKTYSK